ncbi:MAG: HlyD family efflux transporter periplasmic adaptor subunit [Lachnospiraceae bacterium]|nr:HlyD family efflux transporter periplasmic adaptor subunit [Lachnospiraceae bacterium]
MSILKKKKETELVEGETKKKKGIRWFGRFLKHHKKLVFLLCVVIIGSVVGVNLYNSGMKVPEQAAGIAYETMTLEKRDISNSISVTGTIASADSRTITSTLNDIQVKSLKAAVGDTVTAGQVLVEFDDSDLQDSLADAKTSLSVSQAQNANNLESAQRSYDEAAESAQISATRASENVSSSYTSYTNAVATEASSKTAYQEAVSAEETSKEAMENQAAEIEKLEGEISDLETKLKKASEDEAASIQKKITQNQTSLDTAKADYEAKSAEYKEAQQATSSAKQTYEQAATSLENAYSSYKKAVQDQEDTTRNNENSLAQQASSLENTKLISSNATKNEENQVETIQEQVDSCIITAPISGVITSLSVSENDKFAGGEVLVIQDNSSFIVEASVDEYDIADISKGMSVVIKTDATGDQELDGEVIYVAPTPTTSTGSSSGGMTTSTSSSSTYEVQISVKASNERLRIGMTAKASILTAFREDVFAVPYDAIETNEAGESVIYVVDTAARSRGNSEGTEETRQDRKSQTTEDRQMLGNSEKPGMPVDGEMPSRGGKGSSTSGNASGTGMNRKAIVVEVGLESDYYTEISSDELKEGMLVITGTATEKTSSDNAEDENAMSGMFDGMSGGGAPGGNGGGRGGMSGGGPGGR